MKKLVSVLMCIVVLFSTAIMANAQEIWDGDRLVPTFSLNDSSGQISTMAAAYINYTTQNLSIRMRTATVECRLVGYAGVTTAIVINMRLQRYKDNKWVDVKEWTKKFDGYTATLDGTCIIFDSGYDFRVKAIYRADSGTNAQYLTTYGQVLNY